MKLSGIDWGVIAVYLALTAGAGLWFSRRAQQSVDDYFVGGRRLPWWLSGVSMIASAFAIDTPLGITGLVAKDGIAGVWYAWSFVLGGAGALGAFIFAPLLRRSRIITTAELIELRYDGPSAAFLRGFKGIYFGIFANAITLGWILKAVWTVGEVVLPGYDPDRILVVILVFTGLYTTLSGLWGIAVTDVFQFIIGSIGSLLLAGFAVSHVGGLDSLMEGLAQRYGAARSASLLSFFPSTASPFFLTFFVFITLKWWGNPPPAITQRIIAAKDERHASLATIFFAAVAFGFNYWPMILAALVSMVLYPNLSAPESGYVQLIVDVFPRGLLGIMLASLLAAFMSTVDTHVNFGAAYMVNDLYRRFLVKRASDKHYVRAAQAGTLLMMGLSVLVAYHLESVSSAWYYISTITAGYGIIIVVRWFWWRVNAWAEITALFVSGLLSTLASPSVAKILGYGAYLTDLAWPHRFVGVVFVSTAAWILICLLTPPTGEAHLAAFCRRVKPFPTFWGPVYRNHPEIEWNRRFLRAVIHWAGGAAAVFLFCFGIGAVLFKTAFWGVSMILLSGLAAAGICATWKAD